jgi:16S rRNA (cytosine967-C5)-methyltransferase
MEVERGRPVAGALSGIEGEVSSEDRRLATQLVYGVLRNRRRLDAFLDARIPRAPRPDVRMVLRMALVQLWFMDRVPAYAVVSSAVEQARALDGRAAGLVNAVLRAAGSVLEPDEPGVRYSLPDWILERWQTRWPDTWEAMAARMNEAPRMNLRVRGGRADVMHELQAEGLEVEPSVWMDDAVTVRSPLRLERSPAFQDGRVYVQDESAMAVAYAADGLDGARILDLCAGVGGKSFHLADRNRASHVTAVDTSAERLGRLRQNAKRLGLAQRVAPVLGDARVVAHTEQAGVVVVDAPCTGLGILRRRPDIRWRRRPRDLARFQLLQIALLKAALEAVEPGGVVVYSVCSTEPEETREVMGAVLAEHPEYAPENVSAVLPGPWARFADGPWLTVPPGLEDLDGFFIARLRRAR